MTKKKKKDKKNKKVKAEVQKVQKPGMFWLATETARAAFEFSTFFPYKYFASSAVEADPHPVLVIPGFMTSDLSTAPMRKYLTELGYDAYGWGLGRNYGDEADMDILLDIADSLFQRHRKQISIIGWSLGGIFARQLAKVRPHLVRQVITMGTPFSGLTENNNVVWIHNLITNLRAEDALDPDFLADIPNPAPVPTTAIYTKQDGIVPWTYCLEKTESDIHQNVEVLGSHLGLGFNPVVIEVIKDRLLYNLENWQKYRPTGALARTFLKVS